MELYKLVMECLSLHKDTRSCDRALLWKVWQYFIKAREEHETGAGFMLDQFTMNFELLKSLPDPEAVVRIRRMIQAAGKYRPSEDVMRKRKLREDRRYGQRKKSQERNRKESQAKDSHEKSEQEIEEERNQKAGTLFNVRPTRH